MSLPFSDAKDHILLSLHLFSVLPWSGTHITKCRWHVWKTSDEPEKHCFLILVSSWWCQEGIIVRKSTMSVGKAQIHTDFMFPLIHNVIRKFHLGLQMFVVYDRKKWDSINSCNTLAVGKVRKECKQKRVIQVLELSFVFVWLW